jgi:hypothetical protein
MTAIAACRTCGTEPLENARFCHGCGSPVQDGDARAEYKQVTVLFADVVHSMDIASAVGAERLREIMAELVDHCAAVVQRYGGTVDKFTGDGIMAVFGAPVALEDHAIRACLAALGIQEETARLAAEVKDRDQLDLQWFQTSLWEWIARNLIARGYGGGAPVSVGSLTFQAAASNSVTSPQTAKRSAISVRHPVALSRCRRGRKCAEMPLKARRERPNSWSFWRQLAAIVWQSATTATANPPSGRSTTEKTNSKSMMPSKYCRSMGVPFLVWEATDARGDRQCCALVEYTNGQTIATRVLASQGTVNNSVELGRGRSRRGDGRIHVCCAPRRVLSAH